MSLGSVFDVSPFDINSPPAKYSPAFVKPSSYQWTPSFSNVPEIGIESLSPQFDVIYREPEKKREFSSPIGASPLQHKLGLLLSPSQDRYADPFSLSPHVRNKSPSNYFDEEDLNEFSLPPSVYSSEHEDFINSMGGMDDLDGPSSEFDLSHSRSQTFANNHSPMIPELRLEDSMGSPQLLSKPNVSGSPSANSPHDSQFSEHPFGEHPSRTLFVRNINSNIEEQELRNLFEVYGPIRNMYTQCKHRGFVMISYFDIRHAKNAMKHLQGKPLRRRKLDIHYSIPKDNPSEKDQNQGTLVVFNLDPSITTDELRGVFGVHGEIKEIRETPNKKHHKFIEFYDVRDAERAMKLLNKTEIKSKKIKIEPSRPGGRKAFGGSPESQDDFSIGSLPNRGFNPKFPERQEDLLSKSAPSSDPFLKPVSHSSNSMPNVSTGSTPSSPIFSPEPFHTPARSHRANRSISLPPSHSAVQEPLSPILGHTLEPSPVLCSSPVNVNGFISLDSDKDKKLCSKRKEYDPEKNQFSLDVNSVRRGEETRTTLMIKNIPNKYTQKMLLAAVDDTHQGLYDFFYLPIDFKNKCNVGYAFVNFIDPKSIVSFFEKLHNTKWDKFNSEKVCEITYARIQGKYNLISHFQNSSLMCEDKKCRPIIFHSEGPNVGQQAPFPVGVNIRARPKEEKPRKQTTRPRVAKTDYRTTTRKSARTRSLSCNNN